MLLNGPNMASLGRREPEVYGTTSLGRLEERLCDAAEELGLELETLQTDSEGGMVSAIGRASRDCAGLIINPCAYSHYSIAVLDALRAFPGPVAEVHLSNVHAREQYRRRLLTAEAADAVICGAGADGYRMALEHLAARIAEA
jgi:3-dehydroquinate dehydratase-2